MIRWKKIKQWPEYEISDNGLIRKKNGLLRKPYLTKTGYLYIAVRRSGFKKSVAIHRLVAEAFIHTKNKGLHVAHLDGNKTNNCIKNLAWVTRSENEQHKIFHGKSNRGERQGRSLLKSQQVLLIRKEIKLGIKQRIIAERFGVAKSTISSISTNKSWGWL
ncbi:MAG: HNH endonuclease [Patescibacteria group bacterium]|nr:HNH endonuclease [Patescibacteria group bacterium]